MIGEEELVYALREARAVAEASSRCLRKKVGAVLFDREGMFLAYGSNVNPPGQPCDKGFCPRGQKTYDQQAANEPYDDCTATHAERHAVYLAKHLVSGKAIRFADPEWLRGGTIVVTHEPCHECMPWLTSLGLNVYWPEGRMVAS